MAIDGLGLAGTGGHTDKEIADLSELPRLSKRAAILFYRLTQPARP
jgi:glutamate carboxypeptidase